MIHRVEVKTGSSTTSCISRSYTRAFLSTSFLRDYTIYTSCERDDYFVYGRQSVGQHPELNENGGEEVNRCKSHKEHTAHRAQRSLPPRFACKRNASTRAQLVLVARQGLRHVHAHASRIIAYSRQDLYRGHVLGEGRKSKGRGSILPIRIGWTFARREKR